MSSNSRPTVGLALSGSGNRTTFYIGFFEVFQELEVPIDFITAMSGGSLVAAAYACGNLEQFKQIALGLNKENIKKYVVDGSAGGGLYSLEALESEMKNFTKGHTFEEVRPLMSFVTVDIESGEQVELCMGDIARAARISCTVPGIFEPVKWGSRTLVDGGLLCQIPIAELKKFPVDITVAINMRTTKHIFSSNQISAKKIYNFLKHALFIDELESLYGSLFKNKDDDFLPKNSHLFSIWGKSLDLAIGAQKQNKENSCDLLISPMVNKLKVRGFSEEALGYYYKQGREVAQEYAPKIFELIKEKQRLPQIVNQ